MKIKRANTMKMRRIKYMLFMSGGLLAASAMLNAQTPDNNLNKEMILVRPYEPSVTDAQKITVLPNMNDTARVKPTFIYTIQSKRIDTHPDVTPINAAKLQALPQAKLTHGYLKAGFGTSLHPQVEVALNTLRGDKFMAGAIAKYDGAFDKVKLANDKDVYAAYSDASAQIFAHKFYRSSFLYGDLGVGRKGVHNYGYNPVIKDTTMIKDEIKQAYNMIDGRLGIRSSHYRSSKLNYDVRLCYKYTNNKSNPQGDLVLHPDTRKLKENAFALNAELDNNMFGGNIDFEYFARNNAFDSLRNNFHLGVNPWFIIDTDSLRLEVGMRVAIYKEGSNGVLQYKIYPKVEFQFTLFKDVFIPIIGIDGALRTYSYRDLIEENPFTTPGLNVHAVNSKLNIYAGLKGAITSKLSYYLHANFITSDNEHFFVNDTAFSKAQNFFNIVTDNLSTFKVGGEIYYNPSERLELSFKAAYNRYEMSKEARAWHRPAWETEFSAKYRFRKLLLTFDMFTVGKRYAKAFEPDVTSYTLKSAIDCSLGAEYQLTKWFSVFGKVNNFLNANYERWNFYPSRGINAMAGLTLSL